MAIVKLGNVPLIPQPTDGVCWYVSARMLFKWQENTGKGTMKNPDLDQGSRYRYDNNLDWDSSQNGLLAGYLNMKRQSFSLDFESISNALSKNGPIWTAGVKTWSGGPHGHVVVICGVADTGVFIHDPEPVKAGSTLWLTWSQIKKFVDAATDADVKFLTAA